MRETLRSKKMACPERAGGPSATGLIRPKMIRIGAMAEPIAKLDRRELLAGLGAVALAPAWANDGAAQGRPPLPLEALAGTWALQPGKPDTPVWSLVGPAQGRNLRFRRGDTPEITLLNNLPLPVVLNWPGIDGAAQAEPLTSRRPLMAGAKDSFVLPLRHAGSYLCDLRLLGDGAARPSPIRALIVGESEAVAVDRDEAFLIEDWRLRPDGTAIAPGVDPGNTEPHYTINGLPMLDIPARSHERLRFRFLNGCQRTVIALKIESHEVRVMAMDGRPAEPFPARGGALVLAPGGRIDVFIDATAPSGSISNIHLHDGKEARPIARLITAGPAARDAPLAAAPPLPSNGLPARLELKGALRFDLALGGSQADWVTPTAFSLSVKPAFRARAGRTVVLALTNRGEIPAVFHLHGHHFRLLDRLDDGWKPFWLNTFALEAGQTQRVAFSAEYAGQWLMETMATDWAAPRLVQWYSVE